MADGEDIRLLKEIAMWAREAALPHVSKRVERILDNDLKKRAYAAMDGDSGTTAIEKATGVNHNEIGKWLSEWKAERIIELDGKRPRALFTLSELGIDPPPARIPRPRKE